MRRTGVYWLTASAVSLRVAVTLYAGGWAVVTVRDLPEYAVAGQPIQLTFVVLQHGQSPLGGLAPEIEATSGTDTVKVTGVEAANLGEYSATLVLDRPGDWTIHIDPVEYNGATLPELRVIAPEAPAPPRLPEVAIGKRLFVAKGCIGCHQNRDVQAEYGVNVGPDLTGRGFPPSYLKGLLADPEGALGEGSVMPDLGLRQSEIAALEAFINRDGTR